MNIFVLDKNPFIAAKFHINKHVPKMIVESAQMLSTAHHILDGEKLGIYKISNKNHPCSLWVRQSKSNYEWLFDLALGLVEEYKIRYGNKHHKTEDVLINLTSPPDSIESLGLTEFAQAMPDAYKNPCAVTAYRTYYMYDKRSFAAWKTQKPYWWKDAHENNQTTN
jgi:hypothetical protein